ncbi:epoxyqueuosine reductase [bacterium]|nr:epoxyqueuosine reductase [bacterium]
MTEQNRIEKLTFRIKDLTKRLGACSVGIVTPETLAGGPPTADLSYVMPKAKSAVVFAVPLDQKSIEPYLKKEDSTAYNLNNVRTNTLVSGISMDVAKYLEMKGYSSIPQNANIDYRKDTKNGVLDEIPPISHRYLAVRAGIGHFGFSGNLITQEHGAAVILGSLLTEAPLLPTDALDPKENYCDKCKLCVSACASGYMNPKEDEKVTLGGHDFTYSKRRHHHRCDYVCGGFAGLHKSGKWSTWSPARFSIPEKDEEFAGAFPVAAIAYGKRPKPEGGFYHFLMPGNLIELTCSFCQLVCHPDKEVRNKRYKMLKNSGVIIQHPDGRREAVTPEKAEEWIQSMRPEVRELYTNQ